MNDKQPNATRIVRLSGLIAWSFVFLLPLFLGACHKTVQNPVTLTVLDPEWLRPDEMARRDRDMDQFTRETGVRIKYAPTPESSISQLELWRKLLQSPDSSPDVIGIDVIWPSMLNDQLIDLKPYFQSELAGMDPKLLANFTVGDKLVGIPYHTLIGVLAYRKDLLREYGFKKPPATWDELENMSVRIQHGERAKGKSDFWGFVWQGANYEGLTCDALEWQESQGGGSIIENDKTISVNNRAVVGAWERARHWVGWISPPSVIAYRELDSNDVWESGRAAFFRTWLWQYRLRNPRESRIGLETGYTSVPAGHAGRFGALGGTGISIARSSPHREEAVAFIRFLIRHDQQLAVAPDSQWLPELTEAPAVLYPQSRSSTDSRSGAVLAARPSAVAGEKYEEVGKAYFEAVHSVLTGEKTAQTAAADVERQLVQITGFRTGPSPRAQDNSR